MKAYRKIALALASLLAVSMISCGGEASTGTDTTAAGVSDTTTVAEEKYVYPAVDYKGEEYVILNTHQNYGFYSALDFEEQTGDALDDAVYARNRLVEEKFNLKLVINEEYTLDAANKALETAVLAGDDIYDSAIFREIYLTSQLTQGMLLDMKDIDNFNFNEPWWDVKANETIRIGKNKSMFYAYSDISFCDFEGALCVFFNENMTEDLGLEFPYELVKSGKWTLDELAKYMKAGANLNGQDDYSLKEDSTATFGLASWDQATYGMFMACGFDFVEIDKDGTPALAPMDDAYISQMQKIIGIFSVDGEFVLANKSNNYDNYELMFKNDRTLTMIAQLKATNKYRDMESSFGILPMPKADANQEDYRCLRSYSYVTAIPVTNQRHAETGAVLDALAYITYTDVMDDFYDGRVSQKSLRNEDSIEMLGIIRESRVIDVGLPYAWSSPLRSAMLNCVQNKSTDVASALESNKGAIEADMEKVLKTLNG